MHPMKEEKDRRSNSNPMILMNFKSQLGSGYMLHDNKVVNYLFFYLILFTKRDKTWTKERKLFV